MKELTKKQIDILTGNTIEPILWVPGEAINTEDDRRDSAMKEFNSSINNFKIEIATAIKFHLKNFRTQQAAADYIGTTQPVVSNIKNYKLNDMSVELLLEYLAHFGTYIESATVKDEMFLNCKKINQELFPKF